MRARARTRVTDRRDHEGQRRHAGVEKEPAEIINGKNLYNLFPLSEVVLSDLLYSSGYKMTLVCMQVELKAWKAQGWGVLLVQMQLVYYRFKHLWHPAGFSDHFWSLDLMGPHLSLFDPSFACVVKLWSRGAHCVRQTVALLLEPSTPSGGLWWLHGKKQSLAQITSFTFSYELPVVCECTKDKLSTEGLLFYIIGLLLSHSFVIGKTSVEKSWKISLDQFVFTFGAHISAEQCTMAPSPKCKKPQPWQLVWAAVLRSSGALSHPFADGLLNSHTPKWVHSNCETVLLSARSLTYPLVKSKE